MTEKLYTTNQLATIFGVVPTTVIDWIERGKLEAFKTLGGHRRITHRAVLEFLERHRLRYPPALAAEAPGILVQTADAGLREALRDALREAIPAAAGLEFCGSLASAMLRAGACRPRLLILDAPDGEARTCEAAAAVLAHFAEQPPAILLLTGCEAGGPAGDTGEVPPAPNASNASNAPYTGLSRERPAAEIARACASLLQAQRP